MIILDTNVLSELMKPNGDPVVLKWLNRQAEGLIWGNAVSIFEIQSGTKMLPAGRRRSDLLSALDAVVAEDLQHRIAPFDTKAARDAADIYAYQRKAGRNTGIRDSQIAGIAMSRSAAIATRNVRDFRDLNLPVIDPWTAMS
jgi:toxin FitB